MTQNFFQKGLVAMMCISVNELDTFYFHDAYLRKIKFCKNNMTWHTYGVCIETNNTQNHEKYDTIADEMIFTFENFKIIEVTKINPSMYDYSKKEYQDNREIISEQGYGLIFDSLKNGAELMYGGFKEDNYLFEMFDSENNLYDIIISFDKATAQWEYTSDEAWYVRK